MEDLLGDMTRLEFVLRFTLSHPALSSTIVGTSSVGPSPRRTWPSPPKGPLPADLYEQAKKALPLPPP